MSFLLEGIMAITWQQVVMYVVGTTLIWLAAKKECEPSLLLPLGFGAILINLPYSDVVDQMVQGRIPATGIIERLFKTGIGASEVIPILLFIGVSAIINFGPLLSQPVLFLFRTTAQFRVFAAILITCLMGLDLRDIASIGIIGAADGPTSILVSQVLESGHTGPIAVAIYSYMALISIIQPFAIRLVTARKKRRIHMEYNPKSANRQLRIAFPIAVTIIVGPISPQPMALVGFLMPGNLPRGCGALGSLSQTAQNEFVNIITLLLGITISFSIRAEQFMDPAILMIMVLDLVAFVLDTVGGVLFARLINVFLKIAGKKPMDPIIGGCGMSAFPMSSRMVQKMAVREELDDATLIQATGADVSGQVASVIAGGLVINIISQYLQDGGNEVSNRLWSRQQRRRRINMEHVGVALEVMGKGMGGIFTATIIIMAAVMVLGRITKGHEDGREQLSGGGE